MPFLNQEDPVRSARYVGPVKKVGSIVMCPNCQSRYVRFAHRRLMDWVMLPFTAVYRCRSCRLRFIRVRLIGTTMDSY